PHGRLRQGGPESGDLQDGRRRIPDGPYPARLSGSTGDAPIVGPVGPGDPQYTAMWNAARRLTAKPVSRQLEIETYTWDVLPGNLKTGDIVDYVVRELERVQAELS
ncbi:MAG: hypothetical protein ACTSXZ_04890, partial [Alphaproteobacteria bacterium]